MFCFMASSEWAMGRFTIGGQPKDPDNLALAIKALFACGVVLLGGVATIFPLRAYLWRRRNATDPEEIAAHGKKVLWRISLIFLILSTLMAGGMALNAMAQKDEARHDADYLVVYSFEDPEVARLEKRTEALERAVKCERVQYRAVTFFVISVVGLFVVMAIPAVKAGLASSDRRMH